jgi:hypothetical protein
MELDLTSIQTKIFQLIPTGVDTISGTFDYTKGNAIQVRVGDSINDETESNDISLEVRICGLTKNKIAIQTKAKDLDKILNQTVIEYYWIVRNNVYYTSYYDEDKFNGLSILFCTNFIRSYY